MSFKKLLSTTVLVGLVLLLVACEGKPTPKKLPATRSPTKAEPTRTLAPTKTVEPRETAKPVKIDQGEPAQIVLNEVVRPDTLDHPVIVFAWPDALQPGDVIHPYKMQGFEPFPEPTVIERETWFFWIDDAPGASYMHPNRFVFVDGATGEVTASEEWWWPVLNGEGLWIRRQEYWNEENWVYSNVEYKPMDLRQSRNARGILGLAAYAQQAENPGFAIVINGWRAEESGKEDFEANADGMHDAFTSAGFDTTYLGPPEDDNPDRDGGTRERFDWFPEKAREMRPSQTLFVYIAGHGGTNDAGTTNVGGVSDGWLQGRLSQFDPGVHIIVVLQGCKSGGFIDNLRGVADLTVTATDAEKPSYGDIDMDGVVFDTNYADTGSEFTSGFVEDWNNIMRDPEKKEQVRQEGARGGLNFWESLARESFSTAKEHDLAYTLGLEDPQLVYGDPSTKPTAAPTATLTPTLTPTPTPTPTPSALQLVGEWLVGVLVKKDDGKHDTGPQCFICMPKELSLSIRIESITISGPHPWVEVSGDLASDGSFTATGRGTVAGFSNIAVVFEGTLTAAGLGGDYTMGAEGGLPGGHPIVYRVEGQRAEEPVATVPEEVQTAIEAFAQAFNIAFQSGDVNALLRSLHPAVTDRYGAEACQAYLETVVENPVQIEVLGATEIGSWAWETDGRSTTVEDAYAVEVNLTAQGETTEREIHLALREDGSLGWFTDCGEPLPQY